MPRPKGIFPPRNKTCSECGIAKLVTADMCQKCYRRKHSIEQHRIYKYNMRNDEYDRILESQGGGCGICGGQSQNFRNMAIDHCHVTGKNRGILCTTCNSGMGHLKDNQDLLQKAINYLKRYE